MGKGACWKDRQREIAGEDGQHRIAVVDGECLADVNAGITDPGPVDALKAALGYSGNPYLDPSVPFDAERSAAIGIEPVQIPPLPQTEEPQG
ncbi:MAG TPA: hypothetical protein VLH84_06085 [Patescibacteria group bacterium]|nr:hypothetical protein [Patescibacteria group bacterium]